MGSRPSPVTPPDTGPAVCARSHQSCCESVWHRLSETLSDSTPKQGAPEATSTIALSLRMVLTPHSRLACWLAAWLHWQHHPRWAGRCPSAAQGKPPGSGRARQVETTGREHGHRCWPCSWPLSHCPVSSAHGLDGGSIPGIAHTRGMNALSPYRAYQPWNHPGLGLSP